MQLIQPAHEGEVLGAFGPRLVVIRAARNPQQFALLAHREPLYQVFHQIHALLHKPSCLDFFLSQSNSMVSWPTLRSSRSISASRSCTWALGPLSNTSGRRSATSLFHWLTWLGCTAYCRAISATVLIPLRASKPIRALSAGSNRRRFAFIFVVCPFFLLTRSSIERARSRHQKSHLNQWSKNWGQLQITPAQIYPVRHLVIKLAACPTGKLVRFPAVLFMVRFGFPPVA